MREWLRDRTCAAAGVEHRRCRTGREGARQQTRIAVEAVAVRVSGGAIRAVVRGRAAVEERAPLRVARVACGVCGRVGCLHLCRIVSRPFFYGVFPAAGAGATSGLIGQAC